MKLFSGQAYPPNRAWNRLGPPVPSWFRRRIRKIDSRLTLQFHPAQSALHPRGVPAEFYPKGVWDVCIKLPQSGYLSPVAVWSLVDNFGRFAPPGADTVRLLQKAYAHRRNRTSWKLERMMDSALQECQRARELRSKEAMVNAMASYASVYFHNQRQWENRISVPALRRETEE
jgi:hypothetical protein